MGTSDAKFCLVPTDDETPQTWFRICTAQTRLQLDFVGFVVAC